MCELVIYIYDIASIAGVYNQNKYLIIWRNESHRGEDGQTREEALRDIGKDLELGQPLQEDDDHDLLLNLFDSIPLSTNNRKGKGIESQCECQSTEVL